ncbi:uncharacterized protein yc1106_06919 [Curvularia clavata]|uniref:Pyridoxamine 5'-phosphate oxidase N-terminal domain-containing protein n=1 Tax=Curvularia clavata TaxID=95742 RepID=A0A9Q9DV42_CURCL|nr:uncharacterized protein yc1106_06919 [Curvularia clavata]
MGVYYETIPDSLVSWIHSQHMFWVGTAPLSGQGHINISPKGGQQFGVIDERTFWYMDMTGSGVETHAHLHEKGNGRICVMFTAFSGPPKIVRIWGTGTPLENGTPEYTSFISAHKIEPSFSTRSIILVSVHQCGTSCGFSVPYYDFVGHRDILDKHFAAKEKKYREGDEKESMDRYWAWKSQKSIDGLPGMKRGVEVAKKEGIAPLKKMVGRWAPENRGGMGMEQKVEVGYLVLVLLLGMVIGGAMALSVVSPERLMALREKSVVF